MDKRKVITAYRRGMITIQECAQILGLDSAQIMRMMGEPSLYEAPKTRKEQPV